MIIQPINITQELYSLIMEKWDEIQMMSYPMPFTMTNNPLERKWNIQSIQDPYVRKVLVDLGVTNLPTVKEVRGMTEISLIDRIIVALDVDTIQEAFELIDKLPQVNTFKVGWQLFANEGLSVVQAISDMNCDVFLDLKITDIPNTVFHACKALTEIERVKFFTFRGNELTASALMQARPNYNTQFIWVPTLSSEPSLDEEYRKTLNTISPVMCDGVVASGPRIQTAASFRPSWTLIAPGIRHSRQSDDHFVTSTVQQALEWGADYLVIGREVTHAEDPEAALNNILCD